ncbi:hypothetical protein [Enterococcus italicus]|uniref:hypothetical protein n=1 Tax=Enterococcus italicus TaxID=246144 RepID=UPI000900020A|nr:hypothetical protein [Enterococcus italicus]MCM6880388.1 hypothetical protein [Enterococcus italicus]OJG58406.1 hypothetical protein RT43_GL000714 [Enterococcus italicus DSM 15952]
MTGKWESQDDYQTTMTLTKTNDTLTYQVDDQKRTLTQVNQGAKDTSVYKDSSGATYKFIKKKRSKNCILFLLPKRD